jgi:hypothetical protein
LLLDPEIGVLQALPPGQQLRIWLSGDGKTVTTSATDFSEPFGVAILPRIGHLPLAIETTTGTFRIRVGDWNNWDDPAPYPIMSPPPNPTKGIGHSHDPRRNTRKDAAVGWLRAWGDVLLRYAPLYPLVVIGTMLGEPYDGVTLGSSSQRTTFLVKEVYCVARDYWLGWSDLKATGIPVQDEIFVSRTNAGALQAALTAMVTPNYPNSDVAIRGLLLRPRIGRDRTRFAAYRDQI